MHVDLQGGDDETEGLLEIRAALEPLDAMDLAAVCGGLQLLATNGHRLWRLYALASLAASGSATGRAVRRDDLRSLLNTGWLADLADQQEDLFDDVLVEELAFHGGSFRVAGGLAEDSVAILRLVLRAVLSTGVLPKDVAVDLVRLTGAVLHLSDHILKSAELPRNTSPADRPIGVHIPGASTLRRLRDHVRFSAADLSAAMQTGDLSVLEPLTQLVGERSVGRADLTGGTTDQWPILRDGETVVVAKPCALALALRHHIVGTAIAAVGADRVAAAFGAAVDHDALGALDHLHLRDRVIRGRTAEQPWTEIEAPLDVDLTLLCLIIGDDFKGVDAADPYAPWLGVEVLVEAHARLEQVAAETSGELLGIIVVEPAGGSAVLGSSDEEASNLQTRVLGLADLETICFLETEDPLGIWKWAVAANELSNSTRVLSFGARDMYGLYRTNERSYQELHGATMVTVAPGSGTELRIRYKVCRDLHGAPSTDGRVLEVRRTSEEDVDSPLYHLLDFDKRLVRFVEGLPLAVWVIGPSDAVIESWDLVETVAYWIAELGVPLDPLFRELSGAHSSVSIEVGVTDPEAWWGGERPSGVGEAGRRNVSGMTVEVLFGSIVAQMLPRPNNDADRLIVKELAFALNDVAVSRGLRGLPTAQLDAAVDAAAPPGLKKHLIHIPQFGNEMLERADADPRVVKEADVTWARERLADHLEQFGWRGTVVPDDRRDDVLKSAVAFLFAEVCDVLDATSGDGLLDDLLLQSERLIAANEHRQAILPARLATYPTSTERLRVEVAKDNQAAICIRFLIEYAVATAPHGPTPWSLRRYDRCLGLLAELLDWAHLDDAIHGGLSSAQLLIRDDGQLRLVELDRYEQGRSAFFTAHVEASQATSASVFPLRFAEPEGKDPNPILARLEAPMEAEAGLSVSGLADLLHAAAGIARDLDVEFVRLPREEAISRLATAIEQPEEVVKRAVDYLALRPRGVFLKPPTGTTKDALPSRFTRRWSYVRRPLLLVETDLGEQLMWGRRHPLGALRTLIGQLLTGRYQQLAEGDALRAALGAVSSETGRAFETEVMETCTESGLVADESVTSLGRDSLRSAPEGDLGDIDVLAADPDSRRLWVVECKDLAAAVAPSDYVGETIDHFSGDEGSSVARVEARVAWIAARRAAALAALGVSGDADAWRVGGLIVTSERVIAPLIGDVRVPVVSHAELPAWLKQQRPNRPRQGRR